MIHKADTSGIREAALRAWVLERGAHKHFAPSDPLAVAIDLLAMLDISRAERGVERDAKRTFAEQVLAFAEERDEARGVARVLAHAYETDNRPPQIVVETALAFPVIGVGR